MFRNIYIEAYKNSIQQNSTLQIMLIHANHIYAGLGCILQDIQFMVGNMMAHIKNTGPTGKASRNQKQRSSMPQKLEQVSFKMPKYQFLPSSSLKYDNYDINSKLKYLSPEQVRSHNISNSVANQNVNFNAIKNPNIGERNDSFEQMFPQKKKTKATSECGGEDREQLNTRMGARVSRDSKDSKDASVPQSQEDFMDYLFKKKNSK